MQSRHWINAQCVLKMQTCPTNRHSVGFLRIPAKLSEKHLFQSYLLLKKDFLITKHADQTYITLHTLHSLNILKPVNIAHKLGFSLEHIQIEKLHSVHHNKCIKCLFYCLPLGDNFMTTICTNTWFSCKTHCCSQRVWGQIEVNLNKVSNRPDLQALVKGTDSVVKKKNKHTQHSS